MKLLHYGLQRSGTNFLETLLKRRYRARLINEIEDRASPAHKHFRLYDEKELVPEPRYRNDVAVPNLAALERALPIVPDHYVVISKDPHSWLLSYRDWARRVDWAPVPHHYIQEYNLFYGRWLELAEETDRIHLIRYIDLLRDTDGELGKLERTLGMQRKILYPLMSSAIRRVPRSGKFSGDRRQYYENAEFLADYDGDDLAEVERLLDKDVMHRLGYEDLPATTRKAASGS